MLSIALAVLDYRYQHLNTVRHYGNILIQPLYYIAKLPVDATHAIYDYLRDRDSLLAENKRLREKNLEIGTKLFKSLALEHENSVLRDLLQSPRKKIHHNVMVAELIGISPLPLEQKIIVNKGERDGAYVNQAVLDANGIIGQVTSVTPYKATVTLISNPGYSLMGQIGRSGIRVLLTGTGNPNRLQLLHVPVNVDIRKGDKIITSGLDERLPAGYPVATITQVKRESGDVFAEIYAKPDANLGHSYQMLLVDPIPTETSLRQSDL